MEKKKQKRPLNCEKKPPHTEKNIEKLPPHGEKGNKKAFNGEKALPPWGDKRSNKAPFSFQFSFRSIYYSKCYISAGYSFWPLTAQIYFFYLSATTLIGRYSPFLFLFSRGEGVKPPPTMDKRLSAHPLPFCMYAVFVDPP